MGYDLSRKKQLARTSSGVVILKFIQMIGKPIFESLKVNKTVNNENHQKKPS